MMQLKFDLTRVTILNCLEELANAKAQMREWLQNSNGYKFHSEVFETLLTLDDCELFYLSEKKIGRFLYDEQELNKLQHFADRFDYVFDMIEAPYGEALWVPDKAFLESQLWWNFVEEAKQIFIFLLRQNVKYNFPYNVRHWKQENYLKCVDVGNDELPAPPLDH
jgi:hypothetical protein